MNVAPEPALVTDRSPIPTPPARRRRQLIGAYAAPVFLLACIFGVVLLWPAAGTSPSLLAEAWADRVELHALQAGTLAEVEARLLKAVAAGEALAVLQTTPPPAAAAALQAARSEIDLLRSALGPAKELQSLALDRRRLRLDWMKERVALAAAEVRLQGAELEFRRAAALQEQKIVTQQAFDTARSVRDRHAVEVTELRRLVEALTPSSEEPEGDRDAMAAAIAAQEDKLRLVEAQVAPVVLRAPMDGVVTALRHRQGAIVPGGEPLVTITAHRPDRLVGFLRQPWPTTPTLGAGVELRLRGGPRTRAPGKIVAVGHALETIPAEHLAPLNRGGQAELGLRIELSLPADWTLHPGEFVDVFLPR